MRGEAPFSCFNALAGELGLGKDVGVVYEVAWFEVDSIVIRMNLIVLTFALFQFFD